MLTGHSAPANPLGFVDPLGHGCWVAVGQCIDASRDQANPLGRWPWCWVDLVPWRQGIGQRAPLILGRAPSGGR